MSAARRGLFACLAGYVILGVTTLHERLPAGAGAVELGLVAGILFFAFALQRSNEPLPWDREAQTFLVVSLALAGAPLASALWNERPVTILGQAEYRDWVKVLLVAPWLAAAATLPRARERLLTVFLTAEAILVVIFVYRFFVLHEAREIDGRPLLAIRNGDPNFLCTMFAFAAPLAVYRASVSTGVRRLGASALALLFIGCALVTESRMGLVSLAVAAIYLAVTLRPSRRLAFGLGASLAVLVALAAWDGRVLHRFSEVADASNEGRLRSYANGLALFSERPLFGHGWNASPRTFHEKTGYPRFQSEALPLAVHDTPLQALADLGLYGFLAYALLVALVCRRLSAIRLSNPPLGHALTAAALALAFNFLTLPLVTKDFPILFVALLAALAGLEPHQDRPGSTVPGLSW